VGVSSSSRAAAIFSDIEEEVREDDEWSTEDIGRY
jgi:hypothetical protein